MQISLVSDAPKHNLALMKLSAYHKSIGDSVLLNLPVIDSDYTYASILFEKNKLLFKANEYGGPAFNNSCLPDYIEKQFPDYSLYNLDYSLGYTFRPCYNTCDFCKVPKMNHPDILHHSIYEFYNKNFNKICLLNNNTFLDPLWKETLIEIQKENLSIIDENGYDIRLLDDEKTYYLKNTKFANQIHFAWDRLSDEALVLEGLKYLTKFKIKGRFYVLIGYNTTLEEDIYRCQILKENKQDFYIMPYNQTKEEKKFKRFIDTFMWRKYKTINEAWLNYKI